MKISIIIPAYNEEKTVAAVLGKLQKLNLHKLDKEIIVIDDGSIDSTKSEVLISKSKIPNLKLIQHDKNMGKGAAVQTGIKNSTGEILVIQDADFEYDPDDIPNLIEPILKGKAKVVYGTRLKTKPIFFGKNKTPLLLHFFGNKFLSLVTSVLYGSAVSDMETGYKVFRRDVLRGIRLKARSFDFEPEVTAKILRKGIRIHEVNIKTTPRGYEEGKKITVLKDGPKALWTLLKYRIIQ